MTWFLHSRVEVDKNNFGHLVIKKVNKLDRNESSLNDFYFSDFLKPQNF